MLLRHIFLIAGFFALTALANGQVRERENSYDQEKLRSIRDGQSISNLSPGSSISISNTTHQFERNYGFSEGLAYIVVNGKWGFINKTGKVIIKPQFDDAGCFREGLAPVEKNGKWGYIDKKGNLAVDFKWDWGWDFYENRALVMLADKWGYIDTKGAIVIEPQFDVASSFSEGLAKVGIRTERKKAIENFDWGYIDKQGKWIIKQGIAPVYHPVGDFNNGLAHVHILKGYYGNNVIAEDGYIDKSGRVIKMPTFDAQASDFHEGLAQIRVGVDRDKYGFMNKNGEPVIAPKFDNAWHYSEGVVQIEIEEKWGFANHQGAIIIQPHFDSAGYFSEGLAPVKVKGKWGYINKSGNIVIKPKFDRAWNYSEGFALVAIGQTVGYVNKLGNYVWKPGK
jgi:hypothetical protein